MSALSIAGGDLRIVGTKHTSGTVRGFARGRANTAASSAVSPARRGRVTRRVAVLRRMAVLLAVIACGVVILFCLQSGAVASENSTAGVETTTVTVEEGQSLWSIATGISGGTETDRVVEQIQELNGLGGSAIRAGQTLTVPAR